MSTWYFGLVEASGVFATAIIVGVGGWLFTRGDVTIGTIIAVVLLFAQLFEPVQQLSQLYNGLQSAGAALSKLFGILDTVPDIEDGDRELPRNGDMVVDDVGFRYPQTETPVLSDVSITVADGERLALVGPTWAGKSTLAKLMARLYDPTAGTITFGGIDLRDATLSSLRERVEDIQLLTEHFLARAERDGLLDVVTSSAEPCTPLRFFKNDGRGRFIT